MLNINLQFSSLRIVNKLNPLFLNINAFMLRYVSWSFKDIMQQVHWKRVSEFKIDIHVYVSELSLNVHS